MTRFWRDGFWRTSKLGYTHWVDGHSVDRNHWERGSYFPSERGAHVLSESGVLKSRSARFVTPNARCPVCGEPVWYFQNEYGSRVFFDDIGWPWPKHPCTDNGGGRRLPSAERPEARTVDEIAEIDEALQSAGIDLDYQFVERHGKSPWELMVVTKSFRDQGVNLIVAESVEDGRRPYYFSFEAGKRFLMPGDYFSRNRDRVSILNSRTLRAREFRVKRFRSVREFLELIPSK